MIKTIIFDNNGVLTYSDLERTIDNLANYFNLGRDDVFDIFETAAKRLDAGEITTDYWYCEVAGKLGKEYNRDEIHKIHLESYASKPGMRELLLELKDEYELAILTNFGDAFDEANEKMWHYDEIFASENIIVSAKIHMIKPNKDIYQYALNKLGRKPEECIFIDDRMSNIESARELGIKTIHFKDVEQCKNELKLMLGKEKLKT